MTAHAFIECLTYQWNAKGRHGTHSPFVYDFIEQVLLDKGPIERAYMVSCPHLALKYENLVARIAAHYTYTSVLFLPMQSCTEPRQSAGILLLDEAEPHRWQGVMDEYFHLVGNNSAVIVPAIHKTKAHSKEWQKLCMDNRVRMSIDLYGMGLLFFKQEFREKQHFLLKY